MKIDSNTIRYHLHTYRSLPVEMAELEVRIEDLKKLEIDGVKATVITDMPRNPSYENTQEEKIINRLNLIIRYETELMEKVIIYKVLTEEINRLRGSKKRIIELRYLYSNKAWKEIADIIGVTEHAVMQEDCRIMRNILKKMR